MLEYTIGGEIERPTSDPGIVEKLRVVRIINKSVALFQDAKEAYLLVESYVELKGTDGTIAFVILTRDKQPYTGPASSIKALEPINFEGMAI